MKFSGILIFAFIFLFIYLAEACDVCNAREDKSWKFVKVSIPKRRFMARRESRRKNQLFLSDGGVKDQAKRTTLAPKVKTVLRQLRGSKHLKDNENYRYLVNKLKNIFRTSPPQSPRKCSKCKG
ncbi:unnamed protein product [Leptidea sinapis]|uniref:Uncharacterized protein n=1 Tax=Leptidea sinapis TaxID=189913 RepID=A0A5E4PMF5_9NEOP|nr:unnamed protein product [Leptidea sinapis]